MTTTFNFFGDLPVLLRGRWKGLCSISIELTRRTSIKDMLESFGLPHTEVGSILLQGNEVDFGLIVEDRCVFSVHSVPSPWDVFQPTVLRPVPMQNVSFIVDVNVGRLARYLRAAGIDTLYDHRLNDRNLAQLIRREKRILLTRDLHLLMRHHVIFGRYIRATRPAEQLHEVIKLFNLSGQLAPFTRCLECNSLLQPVSKKNVLHRLEPLTKKYYSTFSFCRNCDKVYWPGSHREKMQQLFADH